MEMEIKLNCPCGTRYGFDVEPEDGHMPVPVACPHCGSDGTGMADAEIQQRIAAALKPIPATRPSVRVVLPGHPAPSVTGPGAKVVT